MNDYDDGFYIDGEGFDGSGDDDCEAARDQAIRQKGGDPERYEDEKLQTDIKKYCGKQAG